MKPRDFFKKCWMKASPSYRKLERIETMLGSVLQHSQLQNDALMTQMTRQFNEIMFSHSDYQLVFALMKRIESCVFPKMCKVSFPTTRNIYDVSYRMPERDYPWSITTEEGIVLMGTILENNLKNGYEIATAFGHSSLFIASAMKQTGGKLTTMDCYIEESKNDYVYTADDIKSAVKNVRENIKSGNLPYGLAKASENSALLGLDNVNYVVGSSPDDVNGNIQGELDFAFIDGGHFGEQPSLDFESIRDKMTDRFVVFFHDNQNPAIERAINLAEQHFGVRAVELRSHWNLTVVAKGIKTDFINVFLKTRI
jgi:hypothetical protein